MQDAVLEKVADLLLEARGTLSEEHSSVIRLTIDLALLEVGRDLVALEERASDVSGPFKAAK